MKRLGDLLPTISLPEDRRVVARLSLLGLAQAGIYARLAGISDSFTYDTTLASRPHLELTILLGLAGILYLLSIATIWQPPRAAPASRDYTAFNRGSMLVILGFACLFRLLMWWAHPMQELDIYRYLWDGRVAAQGIPPYRFTPGEIDRHAHAPHTPRQFRQLVDLTTRSQPIATILSRVQNRELPGTYPPLSQAVFAIVARLTPEQASVNTQIRIMKGGLLLFDLGTIAALIALLRHLHWPVRRILVFAWCPLVLKAFANSGHLDSIAVCLLTIAVWLIARRTNRWHPRPAALGDTQSSACVAAILWAAATLAKLYPVILLPVFARAWWNQLRWRFLSPLFVYAITLAVVYAPIIAFVQGTNSDNIIADQSGKTVAILPSHHPLEGLSSYLSRWKINDFIFTLILKNLEPTTETNAPQPWFSLLPASSRTALTTTLESAIAALGIKTASISPPFLAARTLTALILIALCLWLASRSSPGDYRIHMIQAVFLSLAAMWYLSPTQNPWHWVWALPFATFMRPPWLLVSVCTLLFYLRSWLIQQYPDRPLLGTPYPGAAFFDFIVVWIEHLPILALILLSARLKLHPTPESFPELEPQHSPA